MSDETPAQRFEAVTMAGIEEGKRLFNYPASRYLQMVRERGAVGAAKHVLRPGPPADGFVTLAHLNGRPDLTTEYTALLPEYRELFTDDELAEAQRRLGNR